MEPLLQHGGHLTQAIQPIPHWCFIELAVLAFNSHVA